jgi:hypothetical protein
VIELYHPLFFQLRVQRLAVDAQHGGGFCFVAVVLIQGIQQVLFYSTT